MLKKKGGREGLGFALSSKSLLSLFALSMVLLNLLQVYRRVNEVNEVDEEALRVQQDTIRRLYRNEKGETEITFSLRPQEDGEDGYVDGGQMWVEVVSWQPRAFVLHNALSHEECDAMVEASLPDMKAALVENGDVTDWRTNSQRWVSLEESRKDKNVRRLIKTAALISGHPEVNQELVQILRYKPGQYYMPHYDAIKNLQGLQGQAQRALTILFYLTDVAEGGETVFPKGKLASEYADRNHVDLEGSSTCPNEYRHNIVKPRKGDALLFFSLDESSLHVDTHSLHGSCPVAEGEKWGATVWVHTKSFFEDDLGLH